jgi:hypothetical protein
MKSIVERIVNRINSTIHKLRRNFRTEGTSEGTSEGMKMKTRIQAEPGNEKLAPKVFPNRKGKSSVARTLLSPELF